MLSIGVDFGTTNSSVAVYDGSSVRLLALDPTAKDPRVMRSLIYIERNGTAAFGQEALDRYMTQNTGRAVSFERQRVGEVEMVFADIGRVLKDTFALIDVNEPGRLFQSLKRFLPNTTFKATNVFGVEYTIEDLLAVLARAIVARTAEATGEPVTHLTIGCPVRFSEDPEAESLARTRLADAWKIAGVVNVDFVEEPTAAIHHFAREAETRRRERVLVFDFGGGTMDLSVSELENGRVTNLATGGLLLGGDLIDGRIVETQLTPLFGSEAHYIATGLPMPRHIFSRLSTWQTLVELNRPDLMKIIRSARMESDQPELISKLETLVSKNYGLQFFRSVEAAKVQLSDAEAATIELVNADIELRHLLERVIFEAVIGPQVRSARDCIVSTLGEAGLAPDDIDLVVMTGGSSHIPAFRAMVGETVPRAQMQDSDAFTSVAAGLALIGAEG